MENFCSPIMEDKFSSELPEIGHKTLRKCWQKIKEIEKAVKIFKELVGEVVLGNEVESGHYSLTLVNFPPCDFDHFTPYFGQFSSLHLTLLPPVK